MGTNIGTIAILLTVECVDWYLSLILKTSLTRSFLIWFSFFLYFKYKLGKFILTLLKDISPCLMIWYKNQTHHTFPISLSTSRSIRNLYNMNICFWNKNYKLSDNKNTQINWTLNKFLMNSSPHPLNHLELLSSASFCSFSFLCLAMNFSVFCLWRVLLQWFVIACSSE